jgi:hypothetical protein
MKSTHSRQQVHPPLQKDLHRQTANVTYGSHFRGRIEKPFNVIDSNGEEELSTVDVQINIQVDHVGYGKKNYCK